MKQRISHDRAGGITVLAALMLVVVIGMIAFALDLGMIVNTRSELQNVADSAALAGGSQLLDRALLSGGKLSATTIQAVQDEARAYALRNKAGGVAITLALNPTNNPAGDIFIGYLANPSNSSSTLTASTTFSNAVKVVAQRSNQQNGLMPLFFGNIFGQKSAAVTASATAVYDGQIKGFKITGNNPKVTNSKLLPFALQVDTWTNLTSGIGPDIWKYNSSTKAVTSGSDGIKETLLYGAKLGTPGNFGTINIGNQNNATTDIVRQIIHGPNKSDFDLMGGSFELNATGTLTASGDPGLSAGIKSALESIIGQPRIIPLYSSVTGTGGDSTFTIVGFAGVIITQVRLTGPNKSVTIQPEFVIDPTAMSGGPEQTGQTFTYRPLQLAR